MECAVWRSLHKELDSKIAICLKDNDPFLTTYKGEWPVVQYEDLCRNLYDDFITECRQNIDAMGPVPSHFNEWHSKLKICFQWHFDIDFPEGKIPYPLNYHGIVIPAINSTDDPYISIVHTKIHLFFNSILFLREQLNPQTQPQIINRVRKKASILDFKTDLTEQQLSEILKRGIKLKLFHPKIDPEDFIDVFKGRPSKNPVNWTCTVYSLYTFIHGINDDCIKKKIKTGIWHVISELFVIKGNPIKSSQLLHPAKSDNDRLNDVDILVGYFIEPE